MLNQFSKEAQIERGTPPNKRKRQKEKAENPAIKGRLGELAAGEELSLQTGGKGFRRNKQAVIGGVNNPDLNLKGMPDWSVEVKSGDNLQVPAWWRKHCADNSKKPMLIITVESQRLALVRVSDLANLAADIVESHGGTLTWQ